MDNLDNTYKIRCMGREIEITDPKDQYFKIEIERSIDGEIIDTKTVWVKGWSGGGHLVCFDDESTTTV